MKLAHMLAFGVLTSTVLMSCAKDVPLTKAGKSVEVMSHEYFRKERAQTCSEVAKFEVTTTENEVSDGGDVGLVKARNKAARKEATHVVIWPSTGVSCDQDGTQSETGENTCQLVPVDAYQCVIGRGT